MFLPPLQLAPLSSESMSLPVKVIHNLVRSTRDIVQRGWYVAPSQQKVIFRDAQDAACACTAAASHLAKPRYRRTYDATSIMVHNQTALAVGHAWQQRGYRVAVVNPTPLRLCHPSLIRSVAEQNILMRSSGLAECIFKSGSYALNQRTEPVVVPQLPILRTHDGDLLDTPWNCDVITLTDNVFDQGIHVQRHELVLQWVQTVVYAVQHVGANIVVLTVGNDVNATILVRLIYDALIRVKLHAIAAINIAVTDLSYERSVLLPFQQRFDGLTITNC